MIKHLNMKKINVFLQISIVLVFHFAEIHGQGSLGSPGLEKRLAVVIGNANYQFSGELGNPVNDARSMRDALQGVGFEVYEYENLNQAQMKRAIDEFGARLKSFAIGLFFYAGHGIQSKGANYLIPVDANIQSEQQIEYDCVQADRVLGFMEAAGSKINIVILDACRNNPFERSWSRAMDGSGLAFMNAPSGSLIAYSTSPGRTASDGSGSNGLYTSALLQNIKTPDITILQMFQNVRRTVSEKSGKQQIPWESTSLTDDFYFANSFAESQKTDIKATWKKSPQGYFYYLNDEFVASRTVSVWSDKDLVIYDPVTNITSVLENYDSKPDNQLMDARVLGNSSNAYWRETEGSYYLYVKGELISSRTKSVFVDKDVLVYDSQTNTTYILNDYKASNDNQLRSAIIFDNAGFAFWRKQDNSYWLYVKGEDIQGRTKSAFLDNDLLVYDQQTNISYLLKDYLTESGTLKLHPAQVVSYQDNIFWQKKGEAFWLVVKGDMVQQRTTSEWKGDDLYVTDTVTKVTYILPNYKNALQNQLNVALVN